jgi:Mlc titration factor MtfA (ptsG expression regulator)
LGALELFLVTVGLFITSVLGKPVLRDYRRKRLRAKPFPPEWEQILERRVSIYRRLADPLKQQLRGHIQIFLAEKRFYGCGGLEITDEMRVTIAVQACLLLLNRKTDYYPKLFSILVYPSVFVVHRETRDEAGVHTEKRNVLSGESWAVGKVILAWDEVRYGVQDRTDGENVVLHEFAHQLDQEDGVANGAPPLGSQSAYLNWARVLSQAYEELRRNLERGEETVINPRGAENPGEFFAAATEAFFEIPEQMKAIHPELYQELSCYYRVDPGEWFEE